MSWKVVRNCGKVKEFYKKIPLSTGKIKTGEFLFEMAEEFAKVSTRVFDTIGDVTFAYKERQLSSIFFPAFYNLGFGAMQEAPTRRKELDKECSAGWLDYWVQKEDKWVYLIEVKHGWQFLNGSVTKDTSEKINSSIKQLNNINGEALESLSSVDTTFKISLVVLPMYRNVPKDVSVEIDDEFVTSLDEIDEFIGSAFMKQISEAMQGNISWVGVWSLPSRMQYVYEHDHSTNLGTYPGVIFVASLVTE